MAISEIDKLKKMSFSKQITFCYLASERFFPNYLYFSKEHKFGDVDLLRKAIDLVHESIFFQHGIVTLDKVDNLMSLLNPNVVATNDFPNFDGTIAMYSSIIVCESVNILKGDEVDRILSDISTIATDAIDCFIQTRDDMHYGDPQFEEHIINDPVMQAEIGIQKGIISYMEKIKSLDESDIETLLELQMHATKELTVSDN